jgi:hypothetical protein
MTAKEIYEASIKEDPILLERKHRQLLNDLQYFVVALTRLHEIMPAPDLILDLKTGEWEREIKPEWQERIDKILNAKNEYVKDNYPEFYEL